MTDIQTTFADLGLNADILESLNGMGYVKPSPIQAECIPHLLAGRDVLGMAQTAVKPPAAAARAPVAMVSTSSRPGSRR